MTLAATRAAAFADGIRRRARAVRRGVLGTRGVRRPLGAGVTPVERVLRVGPRGVPPASPRGARFDVRVSLALRFAGAPAQERAAGREPAMPLSPQALRTESGLRTGGGRVFALPGRADPAGRAPARDGRAVPRDARVRPPAPAPLVLRHAVTGGAPVAAPPTAPSVASTPRSAPPTLALVHRAAPAQASGAPATPPPAAGASDRGQVLMPLTAADLPRVVERVVGEIDRRVTAARERRGWTA